VADDPNIVPEDYPLLRSDRNSVAAIRPAHCEVTLAKSIVLAFFLTMVLGLTESVSIQSMSVRMVMNASGLSDCCISQLELKAD
jgi:hypothetical protein